VSSGKIIRWIQYGFADNSFSPVSRAAFEHIFPQSYVGFHTHGFDRGVNSICGVNRIARLAGCLVSVCCHSVTLFAQINVFSGGGCSVVMLRCYAHS